MKLKAYRLTKARYAESAFTGEGARQYGGRWSPPGIPIVYLADSLPLAVLEVLVHLERSQVLASFVYFEVEFDDELVLSLDSDDLPADWRSNPEGFSTSEIGASWVREGASALLRVPSAIVPVNYNYLLNPLHPDSSRVNITEPSTFSLDPRLA